MSRAKFKIVLSELAALDLADILQYTLETWGEAQMDTYAVKLERAMRLLETQPLAGKPREDLFPGCRALRAEQHVVLYEVVDRDVRVARIFHGRVDIPRHI